MENECWLGTFIRVVGTLVIMIILIKALGANIFFIGFGLLLLWAYYEAYLA